MKVIIPFYFKVQIKRECKSKERERERVEQEKNSFWKELKSSLLSTFHTCVCTCMTQFAQTLQPGKTSYNRNSFSIRNFCGLAKFLSSYAKIHFSASACIWNVCIIFHFLLFMLHHAFKILCRTTEMGICAKSKQKPSK